MQHERGTRGCSRAPEFLRATDFEIPESDLGSVGQVALLYSSSEADGLEKYVKMLRFLA